MNEITLKVNQEALVRNLKFGFTSQVTVLGELMQNARRAKASVVAFDYEESSHRLTVTDDGIGIGDLQQARHRRRERLGCGDHRARAPLWLGVPRRGLRF